MINALYLLSLDGDVMIDKQFTGHFPRSCLEEYWSTYAAKLGDIDELPSVQTHSKFAFIQIKRNDVILLAVASQEVPPMAVIEMLKMIGGILHHYFKEVGEDTIRENFSLVYNLLEEVLDNGYPLTTEFHLLEELVPPPTVENKIRTLLDAHKKGKGGNTSETNVPWRPLGLKYANNEVLFDLYEYLDCILDVDGAVIRASVRGSIEVTSKLSGMPDILLRLNGADAFEDVAYHRCVRHARYETDRGISFVPPDGPFTLFQYRCKSNAKLQPPFYVTPQVSYHPEGGRINIMVGARHNHGFGIGSGMGEKEKAKEVTKLVLRIPLPPNCDSVNISSASHGKHSFDASSKVLTWRLGNLPATATPSLSGEFSYGRKQVGVVGGAMKEAGPSQGTGESVSVEFSVANFAISGVSVDAVNVLNEAYKPYKGVKYMTKAGVCTIRMS